MTDARMTLLAWLGEHDGAQLTAVANAPGLALVDVECLAADLVAEEPLERMPVQ